MVLVEDMVSRRHAKITVNGDTITIQDLGSTNGTFVNGERIERMTLNDGDRVLIGTSIIKLVTTDGPAAPQRCRRSSLEEVAAGRRTNQVRSMSGAIDEVPLPDLLQLFGSSRKTGVLVIKTDTDVGKIFLERGSIVFASINESDMLGAGEVRAPHPRLAPRHLLHGAARADRPADAHRALDRGRADGRHAHPRRGQPLRAAADALVGPRARRRSGRSCAT